MSKFKKQIATALIAATAAFGLAACDPVDDNGTVTTPPAGTDTTTTDPTTDTTDPTGS